MNIDDRVKTCMLLDFYGGLLTERQLVISKRYFEDDASLVEIAEELGISRQAVLDALKTSENMLLNFESKLELSKRHFELKHAVEEIIKKAKDSGASDEVLSMLHDLDQYL